MQREGNEHSGSGNGGASSLKKRLSPNPSAAGQTPECPTTLTACHFCLEDPGSFVFVTICGRSYAPHEFIFRQPAAELEKHAALQVSVSSARNASAIGRCRPLERREAAAFASHRPYALFRIRAREHSPYGSRLTTSDASALSSWRKSSRRNPQWFGLRRSQNGQKRTVTPDGC